MIRVPVAERDKSDDQMQSQRIDFSRLEIPEIRVEFPVIQRSIADLLAKNNRFNPSVENKNAIIGASKTQLPVEIWLMIVSMLDIKSAIRLSETCKTLYTIVFSVSGMEQQYKFGKMNARVNRQQDFLDFHPKNKLVSSFPSLPIGLLSQQNIVNVFREQPKPHQPGANGFQFI